MVSNANLLKKISIWKKANDALIFCYIIIGEKVLFHKTFHSYTVRQGQGGSQGSHDNKRGAAKSAGASLRRYNEATHIQVSISRYN